MRVLVVGASGAIGTRLVPQLIARGHEVIGTYRTPTNAERVGALGAEPDRARPARRARRAQGCPRQPSPTRSSTRRRHWRTCASPGTSTAASRRPTGFAARAPTRCWPLRARRAWRGSSRRATPARGTRARAGGSRPRRTRSTPTPSRDARDRSRHAVSRRGGHRCRRDRASLRRLLRRLQRRAGRARAQATVPDRRRRGGVSSFIHLDDAAAATVLALEHDGPAIYNIVDDEPAPVREWLPVLADALGAKPPRHFPVWLARLFAARPPSCSGPRPAAPPTPRPSASSAGRCATRAGGRASQRRYAKPTAVPATPKATLSERGVS